MLVLTKKNIHMIVSHMLNIECGYTVFNQDMTLCENVVPIEHYGLHQIPVCGLCYYNAVDFTEEELVIFIKKIYKIISNYEKHLLVERNTSITGAVEIKKNQFINGTYIIKAKTPFITTKPEINLFPARMMVMLPITYNISSMSSKIPPHYSTRASFMWYFLPIQFYCKTNDVQSIINSSINSIYLDLSNYTIFKHMDITYELTPSNIRGINIVNLFSIKKVGLYIQKIKPGELNLCYIHKSDRSIFNSTVAWSNIFSAISYKLFSYFTYVNDGECCINCDKKINNFGTVLPFDSEIKEGNLATIYCSNCFNYVENLGTSYYQVFKLNTLHNVIELHNRIYKIKYEYFIDIIKCMEENVLDVFMEKYNEMHYNNIESNLCNREPTNIIISSYSIMTTTDCIQKNYNKNEDLILITHLDFINMV